MVYLKFGDGKSTRHKAYSTDNPSFVWWHRKDKDKSMGKAMEKAILQPLAAKHAGVIEAMGSSSTGSDTEWYGVYLGTDKHAARECKTKLWTALSDYRQRKNDSVDQYRGKTRKDYIAEVAKLVEGCAKKGKEDPKFVQLEGEKNKDDFSDSPSDGSKSRS
ncbi:hypothetical protein H0H87_011631 [Tephrocybe sp. NHM501043]|nr:hypothetical protein H0H87_011631 [Tephrocybe sp. NHM501043]